MEEESWHRRLAILIAAQLPERHEDAVAVLRATERLVDDYLTEPEMAAGSVATLREV